MQFSSSSSVRSLLSDCLDFKPLRVGSEKANSWVIPGSRLSEVKQEEVKGSKVAGYQLKQETVQAGCGGAGPPYSLRLDSR